MNREPVAAGDFAKIIESIDLNLPPMVGPGIFMGTLSLSLVVLFNDILFSFRSCSPRGSLSFQS